MPDVRIPGGILTVAGDYQPGDQAPAGYLDWHEWADVQHKAGLRQVECGRCGMWRYPQELSGKTGETTGTDRKGCKHAVVFALCLKCEPEPCGKAGTTTTSKEPT